LKVAGDKHPADEIGRALSQAGGILASLANCYDDSEKNFELSQPFVAEALRAVEVILAKANLSLTSLYENYDLSPILEIKQLRDSAGKAEAEEDTETESESQQEEDESQAVQDEQKLQEDADSEEAQSRYSNFGRPMPFVNLTLAARDDAMRAEDMIDQPAQSYEELFQKLTAMTIAAAQDQNLLPVLESLRQDVERLRNAS
jgi:hypothetical protein